jgi:diadenosine tetraphosphate (Ap4A) HIT family hydrolase
MEPREMAKNGEQSRRTEEGGPGPDPTKGLDPNTVPGCPFCGQSIDDRIIHSYGTMVAIRDKYPVSPYHTLVIPRRHAPDLFSMTPEEWKDSQALLLSLREEILGKDPSVTGFNMGVNCGNSAGQTIMHAHFHLIPRRKGDTPNPRGGVRGAIPEKMGY